MKLIVWIHFSLDSGLVGGWKWPRLPWLVPPLGAGQWKCVAVDAIGFLNDFQCTSFNYVAVHFIAFLLSLLALVILEGGGHFSVVLVLHYRWVSEGSLGEAHLDFPPMGFHIFYFGPPCFSTSAANPPKTDDTQHLGVGNDLGLTISRKVMCRKWINGKKKKNQPLSIRIRPGQMGLKLVKWSRKQCSVLLSKDDQMPWHL